MSWNFLWMSDWGGKKLYELWRSSSSAKIQMLTQLSRLGERAFVPKLRQIFISLFRKKSWATPLISDYLCPLFLFQIFGSHWLKAHTRLFFSSFHVHNAACIDVHSKTLSGLPVLIIGLSAELAKVPHLAIDWHFPTTSADEPARVFDKHLYPNWLWLCGFCGFSSVLWEPMGDGKRVISLADNHALLWDLQESSTRATVRE